MSGSTMTNLTTSRRTRSVMTAGILGMTLAACAGNNPAIERAELAADGLRNDAKIERYAPVALDRTEESLQRLKAAEADDASQAELDHLAYLVERRVEVTDLRAATVANREEVEKLDARRQAILVAAESLEADAARQEAASALREAQEAKSRAEALQQELDDLEAEQTERGLLVTIGDVLFDVDGAQLKPGGIEQIGRIAEVIKGDPKRTVVIEGHTDSTGSEGYNLKLSEERANAVKAALVSDGVPAEQISARGYGETYPVATNEEESGRQQNRRVELIIQDS